MLQNFIAKVIHATVKLKTKLLIVEDKAFIKTLDAEKIVDNGQVYGKTGDIRELVIEPMLGQGEKPGPGKNCNFEGTVAKPARADHTHRIPGKGNDQVLGHVRLCDDIDKDYDKDRGYAATPKAVRTIANAYLKLDGSSQMSGTIKTVGNSANTSYEGARHAIKIGSASYLTDLGTPGVTHIISATAPENGALAFGKSKSTILLSKNTGHLYVRNDAQEAITDDQGEHFTVSGERMLLDYEVEFFLDNTKKTYWMPARAGWYRIYCVGPGGAGAAGVAKCIKSSCLGDFHGDNTKPADYANYTKYESGSLPTGVAIAGCGGGGGGVAITDIYVPTIPYSYSGKANGTVKVPQTNDNGDIIYVDGVIQYDTETCYVETVLAKEATLVIDAYKASVSNLFAVTGTTKRFEAEDVDADLDDVELIVESDPMIGWRGFPATKGSTTMANGGKNYLHSMKTPAASSCLSNLGQLMTSRFYGFEVVNASNGIVVGAYLSNKYGSDTKIWNGDYFLRFGKRWDPTSAGASQIYTTGTSTTETQAVWICYSSSHKEKFRLEEGPRGASNKTHYQCFTQLIVDTTPFNDPKGATLAKLDLTKMTPVGPSYVTGVHLGFPHVHPKNYHNINSDNSTNVYEYWDVTFSAPGLGGNATGGDVNFVGGMGGMNGTFSNDVTDRTGELPPLKRVTNTSDEELDIPDYVSFPNTNNQSVAGNKMRIRSDGYCGGVPGRNGITGSIGANGVAGSVLQKAIWEQTWNSSTSKMVQTNVGTTFARSGYGSGLNITELGNYTGDIKSKTANYTKHAVTVNKKGGGQGLYGGGGGGGCAIISKAKSGGCSSTCGTAGKAGAGCIVIAYFGDCEPKSQTNLSNPSLNVDTNKDLIPDYYEVFLTYQKDETSVDKLEYDPKRTVIPLYENGELSEWGTGTLDPDRHRPTNITPAPGYGGDPIYTPSDTTFSNSSETNILVSFERDSTQWFNVSFIAGEHGSLSGSTEYQFVLTGSPILAAGSASPELGKNMTAVYIPTPIADTGYHFKEWTPSIPSTVTSTATYTATFEADATT